MLQLKLYLILHVAANYASDRVVRTNILANDIGLCIGKTDPFVYRRTTVYKKVVCKYTFNSIFPLYSL